MTRTILAGVALVTLVGTAHAADLLPKAPIATTYNWSGCYVGANVGGVWARTANTWTANPLGFPVSGPVVNAAGTGDIDTGGVIAGGQFGCNEQRAAVVYGLEADFNYTNLSGSRDGTIPSSPGPSTAHSEFSSRWLSTVRGRLGWAQDRHLFYVTGGAAVASIETLDVGTFVPTAANNTVSDLTTRVGWTVGGGGEYALSGGWSVKAEYLYADFGSFTTISKNSLPFPPGTIRHDHRLREHIVRAGLNFRFAAK